MSKFITFLKNLRPEYKVALFFVILLAFYGMYSFVIQVLDIKMFSFSGGTSQGGYSSGSGVERKDVYDTKSSISEAISAKRPVIIAPNQMREGLSTMVKDMPDVKGAELATETETPTVWVYLSNDGERRDDLAAKYCVWLHDNGIMASRVTVLDEAGRARGKIIEMGDKKCM